jgi:hypothetical protein
LDESDLALNIGNSDGAGCYRDGGVHVNPRSRGSRMMEWECKGLMMVAPWHYDVPFIWTPMTATWMFAVTRPMPDLWCNVPDTTVRAGTEAWKPGWNIDMA